MSYGKLRPIIVSVSERGGEPAAKDTGLPLPLPGRFSSSTNVPFGATRYAYKFPL